MKPVLPAHQFLVNVLTVPMPDSDIGCTGDVAACNKDIKVETHDQRY